MTGHGSIVQELGEMAASVAMADDVTQIYRALRVFAEAAAGCTGLFVGLLDGSGQRRICVYAATEGEEADVSDFPVLPLTDSPSSQAILTKKIVLVEEDLEALVGKLPGKSIGVGPMAESSVSIPLIVLGQVIGAFDVQARERHAFTPAHITAMQLAADLAAIATQTVRLRDEERATMRALEDSNRRHAELSAELERRVQERTERLTEANTHLEAFAWSVSHDLRAPLRAIDGFAELLADASPDLGEDPRHYLDVIRSKVQRMDALIARLLEFSRITTVTPQMTTVDLDVLVREVVAETTAEALDRTIDVTIEPLGTARCDATLVRQVWQNLVQNAVKFTAGREVATIRIGVDRTPEGNVYRIEDNGAGFDMRYASKLFVAFQRLHPQREFSGSGVGLALVARVISRHGGWIVADAAPGVGATFRFTLGAGTG